MFIVEKIAMQVLQIYNNSPSYREDSSKAAVVRAIDAVLTYPMLDRFPDALVCKVHIPSPLSLFSNHK